ncbi:LysR family transcriptional regulator substrate-binding protein [Streptomyces chilikensis]|uniref:LysR family transcriptional regulator substrate-binding protein n=1 Tax=Streptomyces chilikensis TaxID=1194079 RepID=A0ABV3EHL5_9ACTN
MTDSAAPPVFRLAYVPGATPAKWVRIWNERFPATPLELVPVEAHEAQELLRSGGADAALLRLPVDREVFSAIPLYTETTVAVVPKDHLITAADEVSLQDLADEVVLHPLDDVFGWERPPGEEAFERPATTGDAVELVAAGIGVLVVPQSLARLHHRRDLTYRTVADGPRSEVALAWPQEATTDLVDDFIGVVRGRTANSTRGRRAAPEQKPAPARTARKTPQAGKGNPQGGGRGARGATPGGKGGAPRRGGRPKRRG